MLRRALAESMKRVKVMATEETVDRRIVVKLLTTYFERGHSPEVLQLMSRMLGFSGAACTLRRQPPPPRSSPNVHHAPKAALDCSTWCACLSNHLDRCT